MRPSPESRAQRSWPRPLGDERGIALVVAVLALVVIGALVAGTFFAGHLEQRSGRNSLFAAQAFEAAEAGAANTLALWNPAALDTRPAGIDSVFPVQSLGGGNFFSVTVTRLNPTTFFIRSAGEHQAALGGSLAQRIVGVFARIQSPLIDTTAAVTTGGPLEIADASSIDGRDLVPAGWAPVCAPVAGPVAPVRTDSATVVADSGGSVTIVRDSSVGPTTFTRFGPVTFDDLAAVATLNVGGTLSPIGPTLNGARCDQADRANWGEPLVGAGSVPACAGYFPIAYASGDLSLAGGRGQGLLLVRGNLDLSGGIQFAGVVIVLGRITTGAGGGVVQGVVLVAGSGGLSVLGPNSSVRYSGCAVRRALAAAGLPQPLSGRAWAQLF